MVTSSETHPPQLPHLIHQGISQVHSSLDVYASENYLPLRKAVYARLRLDGRTCELLRLCDAFLKAQIIENLVTARNLKIATKRISECYGLTLTGKKTKNNDCRAKKCFFKALDG